MKCDFIRNYHVFNSLQKQLQNCESFKTQRENSKKGHYVYLYDFLFIRFRSKSVLISEM